VGSERKLPEGETKCKHCGAELLFSPCCGRVIGLQERLRALLEVSAGEALATVRDLYLLAVRIAGRSHDPT